MALRIATVHIQGKSGAEIRLGLPTDGDLSDGFVPLDENDLVVDAIDSINEQLKAVGVERKRTLLKSSDTDVAFDGDPNDLAAPAIIQTAVVGTWYLGESANKYYARHPNRWIVAGERTEGSNFSIYVDPVTGDDDNVGDATRPLATLEGAAKRAPLYASNVTIELAAGEHVINNESFGPESIIFSNWKKSAFSPVLTVRGQTSTVQTVTVTGATDNVLTVSDTLIPGALVGNFIAYEPFIDFPVNKWIIANTTNTITLAVTVSGFGGFLPMPSAGPTPISRLDTVVVPPVVSPSLHRVLWQGDVRFFYIDFDGDRGAGGFRALETAGPEISAGIIEACKFRNWTQGTDVGTTDILDNWFENCTSYGVSATRGTFFTGDNVFKDCQTCIRAADQSEMILGAAQMAWVLSCQSYLSGRTSGVTDFHTGYWLEGGGVYVPLTYVQLESAGAAYSKANVSIRKRGGSADWNTVISTISGGASFDLFDSATAQIGATSVYINDGVNSISLADYNAGNPPASAVRQMSNGKGVFSFD